MPKKKIINFLILYFNFLIYSLSMMFLKLASGFTFGDFELLFYYACAVLMLFLYALLWQQVLKRFSLSFAYGNRAVIIPFGMFWGWLIFKETITLTMVLGVALVLLGVVLIAGDANE